MLKKLIPAIAAISLLAAFTVFGARAEAPDITVSAQSAILMEASTGAVLYEKAPDERMLIASTTKLMTALVTLEHAGLEDVVEVPAQCEGVEGSSMYLKRGERLTVRELLYGLLLESGNDAAEALACHVAGSVEGFARLMNDRAASLGLKNTHFVNPHGLNAQGHYSSSRDLAVIMLEAMDNPAFAQIASTRSATLGTRTFTNHNKLMWSYDGMLAGKTGYTKKAGRTLVTCAEREGMRLICVTLNDEDDWNDQTRLYDWAFENWQLRRPVTAGQKAADLPVISGTAPSVKVLAKNSVSLLTEKGTPLEVRLELPEFVYAAVKTGDRAGTLTVLENGEPTAEVELVYGQDVDRDESQRLRPLERVKRYITGLFRPTGTDNWITRFLIFDI